MKKIDNLIDKYLYRKSDLMALTEAIGMRDLTKFMFKIATAKSIDDARRLSSMLGDIDNKLWNEYIKILDKSPDEEQKIQKYVERELKYKGDVRQVPENIRADIWAITLYLAKTGELKSI
ncbi:MAG TPA: hypothetical protein P5293_00390 [Bacteroidales bacterium]|nr:hypothetical protein [Bacteroidales bacterium]